MGTLLANLAIMLNPFSQSVCSYTVHRIAHPTDLAEASENALKWAIHLAQANNAELLLLHVVPPATPIFEAQGSTKAQAELKLSLVLTQAKLSGLRARAFVLCGAGSISHQILKAAQLEEVDVIVMGTRVRTALSRLLGGSIAARVISRAFCPVLVIPSRLTGQRHSLSLRLHPGQLAGS